MTRIALVVSDVDGTMVTKDKVLTDGAKRAVQRLHDAGIGFTITSSRPPVGMRFLVAPLGITLPIGPFNGSSIVDTDLKPIEQARAYRALMDSNGWTVSQVAGESMCRRSDMRARSM